jgi:hypothetical protein
MKEDLKKLPPVEVEKKIDQDNDKAKSYSAKP